MAAAPQGAQNQQVTQPLPEVLNLGKVFHLAITRNTGWAPSSVSPSSSSPSGRATVSPLSPSNGHSPSNSSPSEGSLTSSPSSVSLRQLHRQQLRERGPGFPLVIALLVRGGYGRLKILYGRCFASCRRVPYPEIVHAFGTGQSHRCPTILIKQFPRSIVHSDWVSLAIFPKYRGNPRSPIRFLRSYLDISL